MRPVLVLALATSALVSLPAVAAPLSLEPAMQAETDLDRVADAPILPPADAAAAPAPVRVAAANNGTLGGGFIEFLFGGGSVAPRPLRPAEPAPNYARTSALGPEPAHPVPDPRFDRQIVPYAGREPAGTVIINTPERLLYLVQGDGTALRYGIGVGRPGFTWAGMKAITAKREWPDWRPPDDMLRRRPDLPRYMPGGPDNPLGARAMYLGSSLYRIHGSNEPWTIGTAVSSGCIRMRNEDVIDLYQRVKVGTKVVVL